MLDSLKKGSIIIVLNQLYPSATTLFDTLLSVITTYFTIVNAISAGVQMAFLIIVPLFGSSYVSMTAPSTTGRTSSAFFIVLVITVLPAAVNERPLADPVHDLFRAAIPECDEKIRIKSFSLHISYIRGSALFIGSLQSAPQVHNLLGQTYARCKGD